MIQDLSLAQFERLINDLDKYSDLELQVIRDMMEAGFDPLNKDEIEHYWDGYFQGNE